MNPVTPLPVHPWALCVHVCTSAFTYLFMFTFLDYCSCIHHCYDNRQGKTNGSLFEAEFVTFITTYKFLICSLSPIHPLVFHPKKVKTTTTTTTTCKTSFNVKYGLTESRARHCVNNDHDVFGKPEASADHAPKHRHFRAFLFFGHFCVKMNFLLSFFVFFLARR